MLKILLVSPDEGALADFASALTAHGDVDVYWAECGETALALASDTPIDLVVTDERLADMTGLALAGRLLSVNPMINCASVSRLSPESFQEASEGLGVMAQLPIQPGKEDAEELLKHLRYLRGLVGDV